MKKSKKNFEDFDLIYKSNKIDPSALKEVIGGTIAPDIRCTYFTIGTCGWPFLECTKTFVGLA